MCIIAEMVVIYYDHHFMGGRMKRGGTKRSFESFCGNITRFITHPPRKNKKVTEREETTLMAWLMMELETEFGLSDSLASEMVVGFFVDSYYRDVYTVQKAVNDYLFPNGYYNKSSGGL